MTKENGCNDKGNHRSYNPKHENIVSNTQQPVFPTQNYALGIDILGKAAIKKFSVVHHSLHSV